MSTEPGLSSAGSTDGLDAGEAELLAVARTRLVERLRLMDGVLEQVVLEHVRNAVEDDAGVDNSDFVNGLEGMATLLLEVWMSSLSFLSRLVAEAAGANANESAQRAQSRGERRESLVRGVLADRPVDVTELDYDLGVEHLGMIASGKEAQRTLEMLAARSGCKLLQVPHRDGTVWAWFGGASGPVLHEIRHPRAGRASSETSLAVGEPASGIAGFRSTHRLAQAALLVTRRRPAPVTRYAEVALEAQALTDDTHARALIAAYLTPLDDRRDGRVLRDTLRAFYEAGRNEAKAAASLRVERRTVRRRLRKIEDTLGKQLHVCHTEIETALRVEGILGEVGRGRSEETKANR